MKIYCTKAARGFSMVELLVAVAISSFLLLGVTTMLFSTGQSYDVQQSVSEVVEKGRIGMSAITRHVRMTGYRDTNWAAGPLDDAVAATDGTSDTLTVSYEAPLDCNRVAVGATGIVTNVFDVVGDALRCNGQPIIDGIEEMQILFGEDTDADGVANRLMWPGAAGLEMSRVVNVTVNLLARSDKDNVSTGKTTLRLPWWSVETRQRPDDGRIRREFTTTVAVRNIL